MELKDIKRVHLIGSRGIAMQGLVEVLEARGLEVSGCDVGLAGHDSSHITDDIDLVLYSSAITPRSPGYGELEKARKLGILTKKRAWLVGRLMQEKNKVGIAVSGMHGKSTTTAMVGLILEKAGLDPLVLNGAVVPSWGGTVRLGKGKYVVAEADEFDRSFHEFVPKAAAVLNIESEHLDYFSKGLPEIIRVFREFIKLVPKNGYVVINKDDKNTVAAAKSAKAKVKYFSVSEPWPGLKLKVWGKHNLSNANAAARICHELGIDSKTIQKALNNFTGVERRMEFKSEVRGVQVYDDYAHHPTEIKTSLQAAREHFGMRRIIVIFQPHQYSRTKLLFNDFVTAFGEADVLLLAPIFAVAGREEDMSVSSGELAKKIINPQALSLTEDEIITWLNDKAKSGDVVITMGAGPIDKVGQQWISAHN